MVFMVVAFTLIAGLALAGRPGSRRAYRAAPGERNSAPWEHFQAPTDDDYYPRDSRKEALGQLLFFDKLLSGNKNISCATCHHPLTGSADWLSLSVGEGGEGLGPARNIGAGVPERVPRNAPHVFNLGAREFKRMFHDGRVEEDPSEPSSFRSPAGADLPMGLDNALAAQAMFPVTSGTEMAGQDGENPIGSLAAVGDPVGIWDALAERLQDETNNYVPLFLDAFDDVSSAADITYVHAANAIAAYEAAAFRADQSPFDRYLRGDRQAMAHSGRRGMQLFYGRAGCSSCHSGVFQTDHDFHAVGMPQIGPGKGDDLAGFDDGLDDFGRERVTGLEEDRFRFRTPTLRNVALTGPWGHDGAYNDLEAVVRHNLDAYQGLESYDTSQAVLPPAGSIGDEDFLCHEDPYRRAAIAAAIETPTIVLSDREVADLVEFLHQLTDRRSLDLRSEVPMEVPSGLPVAD
jgi:cytochrome c peroxidase